MKKPSILSSAAAGAITGIRSALSRIAQGEFIVSPGLVQADPLLELRQEAFARKAGFGSFEEMVKAEAKRQTSYMKLSGGSMFRIVCNKSKYDGKGNLQVVGEPRCTESEYRAFAAINEGCMGRVVIPA